MRIHLSPIKLNKGIYKNVNSIIFVWDKLVVFYNSMLSILTCNKPIIGLLK